MANSHAIATTAAMLALEYGERAGALGCAVHAGSLLITPRAVADDAVRLHRIAASTKRRAERACNGIERYNAKLGRYMAEWTDADEAAKDRADAKALTAAQEIADRYGAKVKLGGDPRGFVLRLELSSGRRNSIGDGWGIA